MARYTFDGAVHSAKAARREVADALQVAGVQSPGQAVLLTSELVANAIQHAGTDFEVVVEVDEVRVRIEIHDGAAVGEAFRDLMKAPPTTVEPSSPHGRGLSLVSLRAAQFGLIDKGADGKAVWFELHRNDA